MCRHKYIYTYLYISIYYYIRYTLILQNAVAFCPTPLRISSSHAGYDAQFEKHMMAILSDTDPAGAEAELLHCCQALWQQVERQVTMDAVYRLLYTLSTTVFLLCHPASLLSSCSVAGCPGGAEEYSCEWNSELREISYSLCRLYLVSTPSTEDIRDDSSSAAHP